MSSSMNRAQYLAQRYGSSSKPESASETSVEVLSTATSESRHKAKSMRKSKKAKAIKNVKIIDETFDWKQHQQHLRELKERELRRKDLAQLDQVKRQRHQEPVRMRIDDGSGWKAVAAASPQRQRLDSDEDLSPERRRRHDTDDEDLSPIRPARDADGDLSSPRPKRVVSSEEDQSPVRGRSVEFEPVERSGLQSGAEFAEVQSRKMESERKSAQRLASLAAGDTVYRDKTGRKITTSEIEDEHKKIIEKQRAAKELAKGITQKREREQHRELFLKQQITNFTRSSDDTEMNDDLRSRQRWGDPMLDALARQSNAVPSSNEGLRPTYQGAPWPNRFNIPPGYRWDGLDRTNGWEQKWFMKENDRQADEELHYKYSVSDM